jgi:hypothetical protein
MLKLILIVAILVMISFLLLGINIFLFRKKFPETDIGRNKKMIQLGLRCPKCEELKRHKQKKLPGKIDASKLHPDWSSLSSK